MQVPFVDLKVQYQQIKEEIDRAIASVIADTAFINGKYAHDFEDAFARYIGAQHCVGVGNGTDALFVALTALGVGESDEVITAANTFIATSEAITRTGAHVVFVDSHPRTYNIDVTRIEAAITPRTKAIVPVHLYGQPADMDPILEIARRYDLMVVEDAAQAHGAVYRGLKVGTLGTCACFSFYPGKNLGAYGDAGAVVCNDGDLAKRIRMFADHGCARKYTHDFEGINSRMDGLQGAVLSVKLAHLEAWNERRRHVAARYSAKLKPPIVTPAVLDDVQHVYHLYVVLVPQRQKVQERLAAQGIATGIHYPIPLPFQPAYARLGARPQDYPVAHGQMDRLLSLPIHGSITDREVDFVIEQLMLAVGQG
jgi:dTDP-4-amino-4,6-dideoxygalactose transaminase